MKQLSTFRRAGHRYENKELEDLLKQILRTPESKGEEGVELRLDDSKIQQPKVFVTATDITESMPKLSLLRSYQDIKRNNIRGIHHIEAWRAALATSAAPSYFPSVLYHSDHPHGAPGLIKERRLADGGLMANNPTRLAKLEAERLFPGRRLLSVVSLGTGLPLRRRFNGHGLVQLKDLLVNAATDSARTHEEMLRFFPPEEHGGHEIYHRLEPKGLGEVQLDNSSKKEVMFMTKGTQEYLQQEEVRREIQEIVQVCLKPLLAAQHHPQNKTQSQ